MQCSAVQYIAIQWCAVQCSAVHCNAVQSSAMYSLAPPIVNHQRSKICSWCCTALHSLYTKFTVNCNKELARFVAPFTGSICHYIYIVTIILCSQNNEYCQAVHWPGEPDSLWQSHLAQQYKTHGALSNIKKKHKI